MFCKVYFDLLVFSHLLCYSFLQFLLFKVTNDNFFQGIRCLYVLVWGREILEY